MSGRDELRALIYDYCERSSAWDDVATEAANAILTSDWLAAHDADLREQIAQAIEAEDPDGKSADYAKATLKAANIARTTGSPS